MSFGLYSHIIKWEMLPGDDEHQADVVTDARGGVQDAQKFGLGRGIWGAQVLFPGVPALLGARGSCESKEQPQEMEISFLGL